MPIAHNQQEKPMKPIQSTGQTLALPRQFSRIFGKLRNLPPQDGLAIAHAAYSRTDHPQQRNLAMRLRIRLLQEYHANLHAQQDQPAEPAVIEAAPPPEVEIITPPAEIIPPPPPVKKKQPKMMMMNLEGDALSSMMDALSDPSDDAD